MNDPDGNTVWVGSTGNEQRRLHDLCHPKSKCKRLIKRIGELRRRYPSWTPADAFRRVPGLRNGVPVSKARLYTSYFIARIDGGRGTIWHNNNPLGCNQREGADGAEHEAKFDELDQVFAKLRDDGSDLYEQKDQLSLDAAAATAQHDLAVDLCEDVDEDDDNTDDDVRAVFEEYSANTNKAMLFANSVYDTAEKLKRLLMQYKPRNGPDKCTAVSYNDHAQELNNLLDLLKCYSADEDNCNQLFFHSQLEAFIKSARIYIQNGDDALVTNKNLQRLTKADVYARILTIEALREARDDAGGMKSTSFTSRLAWCKPDKDLPATLGRRLEFVDILLNEKLSQSQLERTNDVKKMIECYITKYGASYRPSDSPCSTASSLGDADDAEVISSSSSDTSVDSDEPPPKRADI